MALSDGQDFLPGFPSSQPMPELSPSECFLDCLRLAQGQVFGYIFAIVQNLDDTQDIFQQTNLVLWQKFDTFDGTNFGGWACRTAQLVALRHLREKRRGAAAFSDETLEKLTQTALEAEDLDSPRRDALEQCLKKLSQTDRKLIDLCYSSGQSVKSVAQQGGRSAQSVSNSLRRIRRALSECIHRTLMREGQS
jgi:RNA polymerase sigma-70 factor (ECF subfamily)